MVGRDWAGSEAKPSERMVSVLELLAELGLISASDLVSILSLPRPTAHRMISQLEEMDLIQKSPFQGKYTAAPRLNQLASGLMHSTLVRAPLKAMLMRLSRVTGQTHHLALLSRGEVEYFEVSTTIDLPLTFPAGKRAPLHCNAAGQFFLSQLPEKQLKQFLQTAPWQNYTMRTITEASELLKRIHEIREQDFAIQDSEFVHGIIGLAVPIRSPKSRVVAMLVARVEHSKQTIQQVQALVPVMRGYAARMGRFF